MPRGRVASINPTSRTIRIDEEVYEWLQSKATPFKDGPNSVLRRLMLDEFRRTKAKPTQQQQEVG